MGYHSDNCTKAETAHYRAMIDFLRDPDLDAASWGTLAHAIDASRWVNSDYSGATSGFMKDTYDRKPTKRVYGALWGYYDQRMKHWTGGGISHGFVLDEKLRRHKRVVSALYYAARGQPVPPELKGAAKPKRAQEKKAMTKNPGVPVTDQEYIARIEQQAIETPGLQWGQFIKTVTGNPPQVRKFLKQAVDEGLIITEGPYPPKRGKVTMVYHKSSPPETNGKKKDMGEVNRTMEANTSKQGKPPAAAAFAEMEAEKEDPRSNKNARKLREALLPGTAPRGILEPLVAARKAVAAAAEAVEKAGEYPPKDIPPFLRAAYKDQMGQFAGTLLDLLTKLEE